MSKTGRPKGDSDVRDRLIDAARQLFTSMPYEKVTTRMLAEHAGVNIAMIRYYMAFPFLIQPLARTQGIDLTSPQFLERLAEHNSRLLTRGLFKDED